MKNYEFQVGDYVLYNGKVIRIDAAHINKVGYHTPERSGRLTWVRIAHLQPIELTEKFLKWAFEINKEDTEDFGNLSANKQIFFYAPNKFGKWNFVWNKKTKCLIIEDDPLILMFYIHQLQHILREIGNTYILDYTAYQNFIKR
jgi:hypothetical protein